MAWGLDGQWPGAWMDSGLILDRRWPGDWMDSGLGAEQTVAWDLDGQWPGAWMDNGLGLGWPGAQSLDDQGPLGRSKVVRNPGRDTRVKQIINEKTVAWNLDGQWPDQLRRASMARALGPGQTSLQ